MIAGKGSTTKAVATESSSIENAQTIAYLPKSSIGSILAAIASWTKLATLVAPWSNNANPMDAFQRSANFQADAIVARAQRLGYAGTPALSGLSGLVTGILALFREETADHTPTA